jgi:hypothetical protein
MVTSVLARFHGMQHRLNRRDLVLLADHGLHVTTCCRWGIVPGRLWSRSARILLERLERVCSAGGLGVRQIVVARKG